MVNLTEVTFTEEEQKLLDKCLKYAPPVGINREKALVECEVIVEKIENEDTKKQMRYELKEIVEKMYNKSTNRRNKVEEQVTKDVKKLKNKIKENNLLVTKADKGNTSVVMKKDWYINKTEDFIKEGPYQGIKYDYTSKYQAQIKKVLKEITFLSDKK